MKILIAQSFFVTQKGGARMKLVIAEKPSVAQSIAKVIGVDLYLKLTQDLRVKLTHL